MRKFIPSKEFMRTYWAVLAAFLTAYIGILVISGQVFADPPIGNGGPVVTCSDTTINCTGGYSIALNLANANTWTTAQTFPNIVDTALSATAGTLVCSSGAAQQLTTTGCSGGGGDTITSPNSTLTVGGTSSATTLDLALGHANTWTAAQSDSAPINAIGAGGANACAGANFPAGSYGFCVGANNGATNTTGLIVGPQQSDFACTTSCTASDSAKINFYDSLTTGATQASTFFYGRAVGGMQLTSALYVGGRLSSTHNANGGTCTEAAAASCTVTFATAWVNAPICVGTDNTSFVPIKATATTTTLTLATSAAASDVLVGWCWANVAGGL